MTRKKKRRSHIISPEYQKRLIMNAFASKSYLLSEIAIAKEIEYNNPSLKLQKNFREKLHNSLMEGVEIGWLKKVKRSYQLVTTPFKEEEEFSKTDVATSEIPSSPSESDGSEEEPQSSPEEIDSDIEYRHELSNRVKRKLVFPSTK